jgi:hypothetical protein
MPLGLRHRLGDFPVAQRKTARKTSSKRETSSASMKKNTARKSSSGASKSAGSSAAKSVGDQEVSIDRRRNNQRRREEGGAELSPACSPTLERRQKVNRRRQIDPTTCERDYTNDEIEFMNALDDYKRKSGRMFPTCSEVLEVVRTLGYVKLSLADMAAGQCGSSSMAAGSATTKWFIEGGDNSATEVEADEVMLEAALAE